MIAIIIILAVILAALLLVIAWLYKKYKNERDNLRSNIIFNQNKINELNTQILIQDKDIAALKGVISDRDLTIANLSHDDDKELSNLQIQIGAAQSTLEELGKRVEVKTLEISSLEKSFSEKQLELNDKLNVTQEERVKITEELNTLRQNIALESQNRDKLIEDIKMLTNSLNELQERSRLAIIASKKEENELGIKFVIKDKEIQLVAAINAICEAYPDLSRDLRKIEWEKVWRPKIQQYRSELSGIQGIYKLTLVEDTDVCYVGQARDVYDRWFEHMKKMVGMDSKGNERLYEYGIGDFWWKVLEEVEDTGKLNEAEKYWIDFYACTEVGLNKKR